MSPHLHLQSCDTMSGISLFTGIDSCVLNKARKQGKGKQWGKVGGLYPWNYL